MLKTEINYKILPELLAPVTMDEFKEKYFTKQAFIAKGEPERFEKIFSWNRLNEYLNTTLIGPMGKGLIKEGTSIKLKEGESRLDPFDYQRRCWESGATLTLKDIEADDYGVKHFINKFISEIGVPSRVNLYASKPEIKGLDIHFDFYDVFVFQLSGSKEWEIFPPTVKSPLHTSNTANSETLDKANIAKEPYLKCRTEAGDFLYIPEGHWHFAVAKEEPSLHLTLALAWRTGLDYFNWIMDKYKNEEEFKEIVSIALSKSKSKNVDIWKNTLNPVVEKTKKVLENRKEFTEYYKYNKYSRNNDSLVNFPYPFIENSIENISKNNFTRSEFQDVVIDIKDENIKVSVWLQKFNFDKKFENLIRFVFNNNSFNGEDILNNFPNLLENEITNILNEFVKKGIINTSKIQE